MRLSVFVCVCTVSLYRLCRRIVTSEDAAAAAASPAREGALLLLAVSGGRAASAAGLQHRAADTGRWRLLRLLPAA